MSLRGVFHLGWAAANSAITVRCYRVITNQHFWRMNTFCENQGTRPTHLRCALPCHKTTTDEILCSSGAFCSDLRYRSRHAIHCITHNKNASNKLALPRLPCVRVCYISWVERETASISTSSKSTCPHKVALKVSDIFLTVVEWIP